MDFFHVVAGEWGDSGPLNKPGSQEALGAAQQPAGAAPESSTETNLYMGTQTHISTFYDSCQLLLLKYVHVGKNN